MKIAIGSDHAGFELKEYLQNILIEDGVAVKDMGTDSHESVDYPDFALKVAQDVADKKSDFGILVCSSGIGMSMAANKVCGIRAALCHTPKSAQMCRLHNNANILALGADYISRDTAAEIMRMFISARFSDEPRHLRRVNKISDIESLG